MDTLPATGAGIDDSGNGLTGVAALGAAGAYVLSRKLRETPTTPGASTIED